MSGDAIASAGSRTLAEVLRAGPLTVGEAVRTATAVADEVAALHAAGRAHGRIGVGTVRIHDDRSVSIDGPAAPKSGLAAPAAVRADDLRGVGRVLAAGLGWQEAAGGGVPGPVEELLLRAETAEAPASALTFALRRLEGEPFVVAGLLPPAPAPARARRLLAAIVPSGDRRTTGVAAGIVAGAAAVGAALLLVGTPASSVRVPVDAAAVVPAPQTSAAAPLPAIGETDRNLSAVRALITTGRPAARAIPTPRSTPVRPATTAPPVEIAGPTEAPTTPAPTATATPVPTAPATAAPTEEPTAPPTDVATPEPSAPATTAPDPSAPPTAAPVSTPAPAPTVAPASAPAPATAAATPTAAG
jgi:hypothetical protein